MSLLLLWSFALAAPPDNPAVLKCQAQDAREAGRLEEAIRLYSRLCKLEPDLAEAWWYLGALNYEQGSYAPAVPALKRLLLLEPENGQAWGLLGLSEYELGSAVESLKHLGKARVLGFSGNDDLARVVRFHQALLLIRGSQFEAALEILDGFAAENRPSQGVFEAMGLAVLRESAPRDRLEPRQLEVARLFGQAAFLEGAQRTEEALKLYLDLEKRFEGAPNAAYAVGVAYLARREPERARFFLEKELQRTPEHVPALLRLAEDLISSNRVDDGLLLARRAVTHAPENVEARYTLGRAYLLAGRIQAATQELERAVSLAPTAASAYYLLGQAYARAGRRTDAERAGQQFVALKKAGKYQTPP